jgi:deoxyribose-phosphate aldolase
MIDIPDDFPLASYIDQTILTPTASAEDVIAKAEKASELGFASLCVAPCHVVAVSKVLAGSNVRVQTVCGFPLGFQTVETKCYEARQLVESGAQEIDMVINRSYVRHGRLDLLEAEIRAVADSAAPAAIKTIVEISDLNLDEILSAADIAAKAGARYVKTSTGFFGSGADLQIVRALKDAVGDLLKIKASGGIRTLISAWDFIQAGASRIGTSSGEDILAQARDNRDA